MKKDKLDQYVGKIVKVTFFDGDKYEGLLYKTEDIKNDPDFYLEPRTLCGV